MQVLETVAQVGGVSVNAQPDFSFNEMANHCEAHLAGKKEKMINLISIQQRQEIAVSQTSEQADEDDKVKASETLQVDNGFLLLVLFMLLASSFSQL